MEEARNQAGSDWELVTPSLRIFSGLLIELFISISRRGAKANINNTQPIEPQREAGASDGLVRPVEILGSTSRMQT